MRYAFAVLALFLSLSAAGQTIDVTITPPAALGTTGRAEWIVTVRNLTDAEITDAQLSLSLFNAQFLEMAPQLACAPNQSPTVAFNRCALPAIAPRGTFQVRVTLRTFFQYGDISTVATVERGDYERDTFASAQTFWRDFKVTSTADAGPGTLRQAILDINAQCHSAPGTLATPCRAAFDIEQKIGGDFFHTVELHSPLPALHVPRSSVDGTTEDRSNTLGPAVALDGAMLHQGNGISIASGTCDVKGIAIGNFPWNGIHAMGQSRVNVDRAYIRVNALGMVPKPNGSRGIASEVVAGKITNSLIAYNGRSGIYFAGPLAYGYEIQGNRIISNGASGIYIGANTLNYSSHLIADNIISNNAHFGIAIDPRALVIVEPNSMRGNGGAAIDIGLDGPTGGVEGHPGRGGIYPPPVITSARYDNGSTTISGTVPRASAISSTIVYLFASSELEPDGSAEGESFLASVRADDGTFTVTLPRDLRGRYVNGVTRRTQSVPWDDVGETSTSEFGRAIRVE
jgi:hypothetical protein